jgi:hypothetical protein
MVGDTPALCLPAAPSLGKVRAAMTALTTSLDPRSEAFRGNMAAMRGLVADLRAKLAAVEEGGGEGARRRHLGRGKLLPRERVRLLLDPGSPFPDHAAGGVISAAILAARVASARERS